MSAGPRAAEGRAVWLLSASKADASAFRRSGCVQLNARHSFMLLDLETGVQAVQPNDIILLKTADKGGLDVFADTALIDASEARELAGRVVASFRKAPDRSKSRRSIDLGLVKFASNTRRRETLGWSRNEIESTIDTLLLRKLITSTRLTEQICAELLDHPQLGSASPLRPILQRLRADMLRRSTTSEEVRRLAQGLYREAAIGFAVAGIRGQSEASRRLRASLLGRPDQLEMWSRDDADCAARSESFIGMHMRRFTGMRLPIVCAGVGKSVPSGPLRHVRLGSVGIEPTMIVSWIAGDTGTSDEVSMTVRGPAFLHGAREVEFVVDTELATLSGMAGRSGGRGRKDQYRFIPRCSTCDIHPRFAETLHGRPATFVFRPHHGRRHLIRLNVLTSDTPPTSIEFLLHPS
jgi:hypothetical protein